MVMTSCTANDDNAAVVTVPLLDNKDKVTEWLSGIDTFLLDCDGVLWRGEQPIPNVNDTVHKLRDTFNKKILFVTNNSTKSRKTYVSKLKAVTGITATEDDIITSASATAWYARNHLKLSGKLYVIGETGLFEELSLVGFECVGGSEHAALNDIPKPVVLDPEVTAVVIGLDRTVSYAKLAFGSSYLRQASKKVQYIATNLDETYPGESGLLLPGAGSIIASLTTAAGKSPDICVGKPSQELLKMILTKYNLEASRTCMVGDRLSTDIIFGKQGGLQTLLVLTGVSSTEDLSHVKDDESSLPDHVVNSFGALLL